MPAKVRNFFYSVPSSRMRFENKALEFKTELMLNKKGDTRIRYLLTCYKQDQLPSVSIKQVS